MPRKSAENISGSLYRAGGKPPPAPHDLDADAATLWREIARDRPPDWFNPGSLRLLRRFCRTAVYAERLHDELDSATIGGETAALLLKQVLLANTSLGVLAAKMRLSTQVAVDSRSGHLAERGAGADLDPLLGGRAVVPIRGGR
jgi:hypothetical protein